MLNAGFGGAERAFVNTCLSLAEQAIRVSAVISPDFCRAGDLRGHAGLAVYELPSFARWDPLAKLRMRRLVGAIKPDVAHLHLRKAVALAQPALAAHGVPTVGSMHNYGRVDRYARVDRLIALSPGHAACLAANGRASSTIDVIPNFSRFPALTERPALFGSGHIKLLSYGRFVEKKGFDLLIEAFANARRSIPDLTLTIAGRGPDERRLRQLAAAHRLGESCTIAGWTDDPVSLLDQHDVFVLPSRSEPFGIVALEAMARGKAILSTDTEGPSEYLRDDEIAILCARNDAAALEQAIVAACADRARLQRLAEGALAEFHARYRHTSVIGAVNASYQKALQRCPFPERAA